MKFSLLLCLGCTLLSSVRGDYDNFKQEQKHEAQTQKDDETIKRLLDEEIDVLNKTNNLPRDKRALGIILRGFMEALGYTVSPIQLASLPNPITPMPMPGMPAPPMPMPMPMGQSRMMNATAPAMPAAPRQRETVRITGVFNFGNNVNTSNLVNHLAQYERIFHGNATSTTTAAPPPPPPPPPIDLRSREPYFVPIPLPNSPSLEEGEEQTFNEDEDDGEKKDNSHSEDEEYESKDHAEEYLNSKYGERKHGSHEEEDGHARFAEAYEAKKEQEHRSEPENRNHEKAHQKKAKVVNYSLENKELHDPSEVSKSSKFNHELYAGEPEWKGRHQAYVYKIAAEQEARAEALAEENADRESQRSEASCEHEADTEFHRKREKEIGQLNEERARAYADSREKPYYGSDHVEVELGSFEKFTDRRRYDDDDDEEESRVLERKDRKRNDDSASRLYDPHVVARKRSDKSAKKHKIAKHSNPMSVSYGRVINHEEQQESPKLRDSYGQSLEKPDGKVDENVAGYISMFKNPRTGVYEPNRIRELQHSRLSLDFVEPKIVGKHSLPQSKYEEYAIADTNVAAEHRKKSPPLERHRELHGAEIPRGNFRTNVKHRYEPLRNDHSIIKSLTTFGNQDKQENRQKSSRVAKDAPIPEKAVSKSLHQEAEAKQISAWPAPFDYEFENTEHKPIVATNARGRYQHPADPNRDGRRNHDKLNAPSKTNVQTQPRGFKRSDGKVTRDDWHVKKTGYAKTDKPQQPSDHQRKPHNPTQHEKIARTSPTTSKVLPAPNKNTRNQPRYQADLHSTTAAIPVPRKKKKSTSTPEYVEKDGVLIIPEPTPYHYEKIIVPDKEAQDDDGVDNVNVKEYRNKVETVKLAKLKKLHPQLAQLETFKYTKHLLK